MWSWSTLSSSTVLDEGSEALAIPTEKEVNNNKDSKTRDLQPPMEMCNLLQDLVHKLQGRQAQGKLVFEANGSRTPKGDKKEAAKETKKEKQPEVKEDPKFQPFINF